MCLILNLYRRTYWLANMVKEGKKITGPEQLKDAAYGCARIRGDTLGIVGLGEALLLINMIFSSSAVIQLPLPAKFLKTGLLHLKGFAWQGCPNIFWSYGSNFTGDFGPKGDCSPVWPF